MFAADWMELDEQWQQRSKLMFQRCVNEPNMSKAQLAWEVACHSEKKRLEWKRLYAGYEEQETIAKAFATVGGECPFFTLDGSQYENRFEQYVNSSC